MTFRDLKYLSSLIIPLLVGLGLWQGRMYTYSAFVFAFVVIPVFEPLFNSSTENLTAEEKSSKLASYFFDAMLYLNIPFIYFSLFVLGKQLSENNLTNVETIGHLLSFGTLLGACGINVAHELGHKEHMLAKISAVILLIPSLYTHFIIEHNYGHHKNVATPLDPATARKNEIIYAFWIRSILGSYKNAWQLEFKRLRKINSCNLSPKNLMIIFLLIQFVYVLLVYLTFGTKTVCLFLIIGIISFLFLETINYIEHYGLSRKRLQSGRYERVMPKHSWNSNHHLGRIILYELTRHSDHHFLANKKYQVLDHHDDALQLPYGYPTSMLLCLIPPLWFYKINPLLK